MSYNLIRVSIVVSLLCFPLTGSFDANTSELVQKRKKMLSLLAEDKCRKISPKQNPRLMDDSTQPEPRIHWPGKTQGDENCEEALRILKSLPANEINECAGAVMPRCRRILHGSRGHEKHDWMCSVKLLGDQDSTDTGGFSTMDFCTAYSRQVDAAYEKEKEIAIMKRTGELTGMGKIFFILDQTFCRSARCLAPKLARVKTDPRQKRSTAEVKMQPFNLKWRH